MCHVSSSRRSSPAPPSHSYILTPANRKQDGGGCNDLRLWSGVLRHSVFVRWSCDGSRPVQNDTAILHDTSEWIWTVHLAVQRDSGLRSRVSHVLVMSMHCAALSWKVVMCGCELKGSESPWAGNAVIDMGECWARTQCCCHGVSVCVLVSICAHVFASLYVSAFLAETSYTQQKHRWL